MAIITATIRATIRGAHVRTGALPALGLIAVLGLGGCHHGTPSGNGTPVAVTNPCSTKLSALTSTIPQGSLSTPADVDCFAWQGFIALNWRADPAKPGYPDPAATVATLGTPGDMSPKVWETYREAASVFGPVIKGDWLDKRPAVKPLTRTSKFGSLDLTDIAQAGSGHHWLTSQRHEVTYFEVMMNRDEFLFVTTQKPQFDLTTAAGQLACAKQPGQVLRGDGPPVNPPPKGPLRGAFNMPEGTQDGWDDVDCQGNIGHYGADGAMEIKASWTPLPADHSLDYRYKTAIAEIQDPVTKTMRKVTVGLVGMHIARKRFPRHEWSWATFEHIDNSPDEAAGGGWSRPALPANANQKPGQGFTFFNPRCNPAKDAYRCVHNAPPTPCLLGSHQCQPYDAPMQITRLNQVGTTANQVTAYFWSLLPPKSVFNYYRLIDVQWPTKPGDPLPPGQTLPLPQGDPTPKGSAGGVTQIVANSTLESFQQTSNACMDCHANYAQIASPQLLHGDANGLRRITRGTANTPAPYGSDYSFIFAGETKR
jgi:hypothetical protein